MNATTRNGTGMKTSQPTSHASTSRRLDGRRSSTSTQAPTYDALTSAPVTVGDSTNKTPFDTCVPTTTSTAGAIPSSSARQKCSP